VPDDIHVIVVCCYNLTRVANCPEFFWIVWNLLALSRKWRLDFQAAHCLETSEISAAL